MSAFWTGDRCDRQHPQRAGLRLADLVDRAEPADEVAKGEIIDHVWDGDLQERNNPMPRWWLILFYITIVFCFVYFLLYPTLGGYAGTLGWSEPDSGSRKWTARRRSYWPHVRRLRRARRGGSREEPQGARARSEPVLQQLHHLPRLGCARRRGLLRTSPTTTGCTAAIRDIVQTITHGRQGMMPALGSALGDQGVDEVVAYVMT